MLSCRLYFQTSLVWHVSWNQSPIITVIQYCVKLNVDRAVVGSVRERYAFFLEDVLMHVDQQDRAKQGYQQQLAVAEQHVAILWLSGQVTAGG